MTCFGRSPPTFRPSVWTGVVFARGRRRPRYTDDQRDRAAGVQRYCRGPGAPRRRSDGPIAMCPLTPLVLRAGADSGRSDSASMARHCLGTVWAVARHCLGSVLGTVGSGQTAHCPLPTAHCPDSPDSAALDSGRPEAAWCGWEAGGIDLTSSTRAAAAAGPVQAVSMSPEHTAYCHDFGASTR